MRRDEYLRRLRAKVKDARASRAERGDLTRPVMPIVGPAEEGVLARIMKQAGFSDEQIRERLQGQREKKSVDTPTKVAQFG